VNVFNYNESKNHMAIMILMFASDQP